MIDSVRSLLQALANPEVGLMVVRYAVGIMEGL